MQLCDIEDSIYRPGLQSPRAMLDGVQIGLRRSYATLGIRLSVDQYKRVRRLDLFSCFTRPGDRQ